MRDLFPLGKTWMTEMAVPSFYAAEHLTMTLHGHVVDKEGPLVVVSAGMHGDEICGLEIVRRLITEVLPHMNVYGFMQQSRYLPDRRDLNRVFPGKQSGSLSSRFASMLVKEVFSQAAVILDLHSAAVSRTNFPHVRYTDGDENAKKIAADFAAPVTLRVGSVPGSLRAWATKQGIPALVYEAGEALHIDEASIKFGVAGVSNVLRAMGILPGRFASEGVSETGSSVYSATKWIRSPEGGMLISEVEIGQSVQKGQRLGQISSPFHIRKSPVKSTVSGVVLSTLTCPWVNEGDGLFHIAYEAGRARDMRLDPIETARV
jgi:predicted deacylase